MLFLQNLQAESNTLRDGLSEFTLWVRQKIQLVEEDIDVCRVIYSLHGSLSQVRHSPGTSLYPFPSALLTWRFDPLPKLTFPHSLMHPYVPL